MAIAFMVMISNTDNKLTQQRWSEFIDVTRKTFDRLIGGVKIRGEFFSRPDAPWQNACWHIELVTEYPIETLKTQLKINAKNFDQDSIAWLPCNGVEFIG